MSQKHITIDYVEKMIDIANEDLDIDIEKITATNALLVQATFRRKRILPECMIPGRRDQQAGGAAIGVSPEHF